MAIPRGNHDSAVTVLSRPGCPLCQDAEVLARRVFGRQNVEIVDITQDRQLEDEFIFRIPVVCIGGAVVAEGLISESDLRRLTPSRRNLLRRRWRS